MLGWRAGIVTQARKAEIDARAVEERERQSLVGPADPGAVRDLVADMGQLGGRKPEREISRLRPIKPQIVGRIEDVGIGNLARRAADLDHDAIIGDEIGKLLGQIFAEQIRPRDADRIGAGPVEPAEGARRQLDGRAGMIVDAQLGIGEQAGGTGGGVRTFAGFEIGGERAAQIGDRLVIDRAKPVDEVRNSVRAGGQVRSSLQRHGGGSLPSLTPR